MGTIFLLALAAAFYPQLLAVVVVILTRPNPNPKPLLWACYAGSLLVSVGGAIVILAIFRSRGSFVGASSHRLSPATYVTVGATAVALAIFVASSRGRELIGRDVPVVGGRKQRNSQRSTTVARMKSRAELALRDGSLAVAGVVGALLALPGPFDLLALGHLARGDYTAIVAGALIVAFALIKFVLIEVPIASYALDPDGTAARVDRLSAWMQANKIAVVAVVVAVIGLVLIGRGISAVG
jgi:Sap-like sulfolipid-1-addressing protein